MTHQFCKVIFTGDWPHIDHIKERDKKYAGETAMLKETGRETEDSQSFGLAERLHSMLSQ
jgi:hypothetical protein